ncbi:MBL fold metallo-hydrolase [Chlamydiota bacterium]
MKISVEIIKVSKYIFFKNYSYLVINTESRETVIIDPSWQTEKIDKKIHELNLYPKAILITHSHFDHAGSVDYLTKKYGLNVYMSKDEIDYYGFHCSNLVALKDDEIIPFGTSGIKPILTPGHTKGGMCYLIDGNYFTGDTIFTEGCGICWGDGADPREMYSSIQKIKKNISSETKIFPGHSYGEEPGKPFSYLLKNNIYININSEEEFISFRMRKNQSGLFNFK